MEIAIDFDGTCVSHDYPRIGKDIGAIPVLKELVAKGHKLILFTMRSDGGVRKEGQEKVLTEAVNWFRDNEIPLYGIQYNPRQKDWTGSNKCYAQLYIDDAALGCPLVHNVYDRPFVDWEAVRVLLTQQGIL